MLWLLFGVAFPKSSTKEALGSIRTHPEAVMIGDEEEIFNAAMVTLAPLLIVTFPATATGDRTEMVTLLENTTEPMMDQVELTQKEEGKGCGGRHPPKTVGAGVVVATVDATVVVVVLCGVVEDEIVLLLAWGVVVVVEPGVEVDEAGVVVLAAVVVVATVDNAGVGVI